MIAAAANATSATLAANSPGVSSDHATHFMPTVGSSERRFEAGAAAEPAGRMTEPAVWLPIASGTMPAATAAAEPEDEPPGVCAGLCWIACLAGRGVRELGGDGLARDHTARALQQRHHGCIGCRLVAW